MKTEFDVFISYNSRTGLSVAEHLATELMLRRYVVRLSHVCWPDIEDTNLFEATLGDVNRSRALIVVIDRPEVLESPWIHEELAIARVKHGSQRMPIVPFADESVDEGAIARWFPGCNIVRFRTINEEAPLQRLVALLGHTPQGLHQFINDETRIVRHFERQQDAVLRGRLYDVRPFRHRKAPPEQSVTVLGRARLPRDTARALLCVSDTHLEPDGDVVGVDAPAALLEMLLARSRDRLVVLLGDIVESWRLGIVGCHRLLCTPRTRPLFAFLHQLAREGRLCIVPGNHDTFAIPFFEDFFGRTRVFQSGLRIGLLNLVHGHEGSVLWGPGQRIAAHVLPVLSSLARWIPALKLERLVTRLAIEHSSLYESDPVNADWYTVFGHTHLPYVGSRSANCGSFLRGGQKTYIEIDGDTLTLVEYHPSRRVKQLSREQGD